MSNSTVSLPNTITVPRLMTPEVVPGGFLDEAQWQKMQAFAVQLGDTINQMIAFIGATTPPLPSWPGKTFVVQPSLGEVITLLPDDNYVAVVTALTSTPPADICSFSLPQLSTMVGTISFVSVAGRFYTVNAFTGETIEDPDFYGATIPSSSSVLEGIGGGTLGCMAVYSPSRNNPSAWVRMRMNLNGVN